MRLHNRTIDYLRLTSPGITLLVLLTGLAGMLLASRGTVDPLPPPLFLWTLLGIGLATAGSSVLNNWYDRDIDALMSRTIHRPLPERRIDIKRAFIFGITLVVTALFILGLFVNLLSAMLAMLAVVVYSYLYTVILKRRTPFATEIGGISGAIPPLIGWSAVKGGLSIEPFILFSLIFLWQPPHFWSLATRYKEEYKKAGIPCLPVVASRIETALRSLIYITSLLVVSLMPYFIGMAGKFYLFVSLSLGIGYILLYLVSLFNEKDRSKPLFLYSIMYLSIIFLSIGINMAWR